jgi:hypothetical protein
LNYSTSFFCSSAIPLKDKKDRNDRNGFFALVGVIAKKEFKLDNVYCKPKEKLKNEPYARKIAPIEAGYPVAA